MVVDLEPPPILTLDPEPEPPGPAATADEVAAYLVELWGAYEQCRVRMGVVAAWAGQ